LCSFSPKRKINLRTTPAIARRFEDQWQGPSTRKSTEKAGFSFPAPTQICSLLYAKSLASPEQNTVAAKANAAPAPFF
jgi:hypothetical protein